MMGRKQTALLLTLTMVVTACSDTVADPTTTPAEHPPGTVSDEAIQFAEALAASGVTVVESPDGDVLVDAEQPAGALALSMTQVEALVALLQSGAGVPGADLDALLGEPVPGLPMSALIAQHLEAGETEASRWIVAHTPDLDFNEPAEARFPAAALLVVVADLTRPSLTGSRPLRIAGLSLTGAGPPTVLQAPTVVVPGQCANYTLSWVTGILETLYAQAPDDLATSVWAQWAQPLANALVELAMIGMVASLVAGWSVSLEAIPASDRYAVGTEPDRAQLFRATLKELPIDDGIRECAGSAGVPLPAEGSQIPAEWFLTGMPLHGSEVSRDSFFEGSQAELVWVTSREASDDGPEQIGQVTATIDANAQLRSLLMAAYKEVIATTTFEPQNELLKSLLSEMVTEAGSAVEHAVKAMKVVDVVHHATEACVVGEWLSVTYLADGQQTAGGIGTMRVAVEPDLTATVTFNPESEVLGRVQDIDPWTSFEFKGGYTATFMENGTVVANPGGNATWSGYAQFDPPVTLFEDQPLLTGGGLPTSYTCDEANLIINSAVGSRFVLIRAG